MGQFVWLYLIFTIRLKSISIVLYSSVFLLLNVFIIFYLFLFAIFILLFLYEDLKGRNFVLLFSEFIFQHLVQCIIQRVQQIFDFPVLIWTSKWNSLEWINIYAHGTIEDILHWSSHIYSTFISPNSYWVSIMSHALC